MGIMRTGRPPKDESQRLIVPLRVMVTAAQRELIDAALRLEASEFSEWARGILLKAAEQVLRRHGERKN
jgi:uncharacterized protein (DUF1778 family)